MEFIITMDYYPFYPGTLFKGIHANLRRCLQQSLPPAIGHPHRRSPNPPPAEAMHMHVSLKVVQANLGLPKISVT